MIYGKLRFLFVVMLMNFITALQTKFIEKSLYHLRQDYKLGAKASDEQYHEDVFAVKQRNLDKLETILYEVSNPKNEKYGQYLTRQQIADLTANTEATAAITKFLLANGATITKKTKYGEYISARAKVSLWEKVFATEFYEFQHESADTKKAVLRALEYSLPVELVEHVEGVFNTVQLPSVDAIQPIPVKQGKLGKAGSITPAVLNSYYQQHR